MAILLRKILRFKSGISLRISLWGKWRSRRVKSRLVSGLRQFWDRFGDELSLCPLRIDMRVHREWKIEFFQVVSTELATKETFKTFNFSLFPQDSQISSWSKNLISCWPFSQSSTVTRFALNGKKVSWFMSHAQNCEPFALLLTIGHDHWLYHALN